MRHPLVTLWRHHVRVMFFEAGGLPPELGGSAAAMEGPAADPDSHRAGLQRCHFARLEQARHWLQFWASDAAAAGDLRWLGQRVPAAGTAAPAASGQGLIDRVAEALWRGQLVATESVWRAVPAGRLALPPKGVAQAAAAGSGGPLAGLPALGALPGVPVMPPLLPALQSVQIEGAGVLPEVQQSIAQVRASLQQLSGAGASLTPAPDAVPAVKTEMQTRSAALRDTLDKL